MNTAANHLSAWLTEKFISAAPLAAAQALGTLATHEALQLIKPLKAESMIACLNPMDTPKAAAILRRLPARQAAHVLGRLDIVQAGAIYKSFSVPQREKMKTLLAASLVKTLEGNTRWGPDTAGAQMSRDFFTVKTEMKVADIVEKLKTFPRKKLPAACLVVSPKDGKCKGLIRTAELAFVAGETLAGSVMSEINLLPATAAAEKARAFLLQGQPLVAVVDVDGVPLGIISLAQLTAQGPRKKRFGWF